MMGRYRVAGEWSVDNELSRPGFWVEVADAHDTVTGVTYIGGAYRVTDRNNKPAKRGKGGTIPFFGESAWSDAERLASDLYWKAYRERIA